MTKPPENFHAMSDDHDELWLLDANERIADGIEKFNATDKPREWWIRFDADDQCIGHRARGVSDQPWEPMYPGEMVNVIEKSAYDSLEQQLACVLVNNGKLEHERDALKASNTDVCEKFAKLLGNNRELRLEADKLAEALMEIYETDGIGLSDKQCLALTNWQRYLEGE